MVASLAAYGTVYAQNDRAALVALYNATQGLTEWTNKTNWNSTAPLDRWHGVETNLAGRVTSLILSFNALTGSIPPALGDLTNLETLILNSNSLTGSIPPALGDLTNLEVLGLGQNSLTGSIPPALGTLINLQELDLLGNSLTGSIPPALGALTKLEQLSLGNNMLTGSIPPALGTLNNLEGLYLNVNLLTGSILPALGALTNLKNLDLRGNSLTGSIPPALGALTKLEYLTLSSNSLTGSIPSELGALTKLEELYLDSNFLIGSIPPAFLNLGKLTWLEVDDNLCVPADDAFDAWLDDVETFVGNRRNICITAAPPNLSAEPGNRQVVLTWRDPGDSKIGSYQYSTDGGTSFSDIKGSGASTTTYTVTGLTNGTTYTLAVRAVTTEDEYGPAYTLTVTLFNTALKVSFGQAEYTVLEGQQADIEVAVSPAADRRVEVPLVVASKGGATDEDYRGVPATLVFEDGESQGTISVEVLADEVNDPGEGIVLRLGELPAAISGGEFPQTTVNFTQRRTAEQFSRSLEVMLAVLGRSTAASAQTAIEGRFERYRQWSHLRSSGGTMPTPPAGSDTTAAALSTGESERIGSEGGGGRGAEGPVEPSASDAAKTRAATGSWLRSLSLGSLGTMAGSGRESGGRGDGQDRLYGSGVGEAPLGAGSVDSGMRGQELSLSGVAFEMSPRESEQETSWVPVLWGQGDVQHFNGDLARLGMDYRGELNAAHVGLDLYANKRVLAGLSFMRSLGDMDYTDDGVDGVLESDLNTVHPYLYWQPNERVSVWGIGGLGTGQVDVKEPGRTHDFDADFWMLAGGVRSVLTRRGNNEWGLRADAFTAHLATDALEDIAKVSGEAHRGRLMLEWVHDRALSVGRSLSLKAEAGGRFDGGDAERGAGVETGFGLRYLDASSGLDVALHGRLLVVHESDYRDWGAGVQASWDPGEKQRGFRASVRSSWGQDGGGRTTLWDNADAVTHPAETGAMGISAQYRMESEVAYAGMKAPGLPGLLTPYGRLRWAGQGRELAWGTSWSLPTRSQQALPLMLELEAIRRENRTGPADLAVLMRMSTPF